MRGQTSTSGLFATAVLLASSISAQSVPSIITKGKHFFYANNHTEFFIRGVAYQQNYDSQTTSFQGAKYTDPLSDPSLCKRDIPWLAKLRTNVIRTYAINPQADHTECMNMLAAAGIYVISDLSEPNQSIQSDNPQWNVDLYNRYTSVIDSLAKFPNTIGFFAGNEVTNLPNQTEAVAFVKAAVRDSKAFIKTQYSRPLYVGYATADVPIRDPLAQYFNCGDQTDAIDFWGYNVYSWCGQSSYTLSGYDERTNFFRDYSVPAFFAEYGCNKVEPRIWQETGVLYGPKMEGVWSGGIAYQYFQTDNNFGLVDISGNTVTPRQDFINLSKAIAAISPSSTAYNAVNPATLTPDSCPPVNAQWSATATPLPPSPNEELCNCLEASLSCAVSDSTSQKQYGKYFGYVCGKEPSACSGIVHDAKTGNYGAYSVCTAKQQLSYVMNKYYELNGKSAQACDFNGAATIKSPSSSGNCDSLLQSAGSNGGGSVPSPTTLPSSGGSGPGSGGAAAGLTVPMMDFTLLQLGLYVVVAALTGAGMVAL